MLQWRPRLLILTVSGIIILLVILLFDNYIVKSNPDFSSKVLASTDRYKVKTGESLFVIAGKYGTTVGAIKKRNGLKSDQIKPGQALEIPLGMTGGSNWYTIKGGDSLSEIAGRYGVSVAALKDANALQADTLFPGQILAIPPKGWEPPVAEKPAPPEQQLDPTPVSEKTWTLPLGLILRKKGFTDAELTIVVDKSDHALSVYAGNQWLKSYHAELGDNGLEDKQVSGDHRTPGGIFYIAEKLIMNPPDEFLGARWLRLSYPNIEDANRGLSRGLIDQATRDAIVNAFNYRQIPPQNTALGGGVGIHGGSKPSLGKDWTWGCIGLKDEDVEDFYDYVGVGTTVIIRN
jgi:LysM repeat protein